MAFFVDKQKIDADKAEWRVREILEAAGHPQGKYCLLSQEGERLHPDDVVTVKEDAKFTAKPANEVPIEYRVNGEKQKTFRDTLSAREILENAGKEAGIAGSVDDYHLQDLDTKVRYDDLTHPVPVRSGGQFVGIYSGKTPVS